MFRALINKAIIMRLFCYLTLLFAWLTYGSSLATEKKVDSQIINLLNYNASEGDLIHVNKVLESINIIYPNVELQLNPLTLDYNSINVFYFSSKNAPLNITRDYRQNCGYFSKINTIICDQEFITRVMDYYDLNERLECSATLTDGYTCWNTDLITVNESIENINKNRGLLINWILSHEIGHAVNKHEGQFFFSHADSFQDISSSAGIKNIALSQCHKNEIEADEFFSEFVSKNGVASQIREFFEMLLHRERVRNRCKDNESLLFPCDVTIGPGIPLPKDPIDITSTHNHPHFMIRLLLSIRSINLGDGSDVFYKNAIDNFLDNSIKHSSDKYTGNIDCKKITN